MLDTLLKEVFWERIAWRGLSDPYLSRSAPGYLRWKDHALREDGMQDKVELMCRM